MTVGYLGNGLKFIRIALKSLFLNKTVSIALQKNSLLQSLSRKHRMSRSIDLTQGGRD